MTTAMSQPELQLGPRSKSPGRTAQLVTGLVAAVLVLAALGLPVWRASLSAPQYPAGLELRVYGDRVEGDIAEINQLNHYVGIKPFDPADIPEMRLWPLAIFASLLGVAVASVAGRHWLGRLTRVGLWLVPVVALADIQYRLRQYGHLVDPQAPMRLEPFTPLAVGPTKVLNFSTWAYPGEALWLLFLAAALLTFGPTLITRIGQARSAKKGPS